MTTREQLLRKRNILFNKLGGYSRDFESDYETSTTSYLEDLFSEFADSNTSVYYSEQRDFYNKNPLLCEQALLEMYDAVSLAEYIRDNGLDDLICRAGALGEYKEIYDELESDRDDILRVMVMDFILDFWENLDSLDFEKLEQAIDRVDAYIFSYVEEAVEDIRDEVLGTEEE